MFSYSLDQLTAKLKQDLVRGVTASWKVWPLVHVINFRFIPSQQRLLYINTIQVRSHSVVSGGVSVNGPLGGAHPLRLISDLPPR